MCDVKNNVFSLADIFCFDLAMSPWKCSFLTIPNIWNKTFDANRQFSWDTPLVKVDIKCGKTMLMVELGMLETVETKINNSMTGQKSKRLFHGCKNRSWMVEGAFKHLSLGVIVWFLMQTHCQQKQAERQEKSQPSIKLTKRLSKH